MNPNPHRYDLTQGPPYHITEEAPCNLVFVLPAGRLRAIGLVALEGSSLEHLVIERVMVGTMVVASELRAEAKVLQYEPLPEVGVGTELRVDLRIDGGAAACQWVRIEVDVRPVGTVPCSACHTRPRMDGTRLEGGHMCDRCLQCCTCGFYRVRHRKTDAVLAQVYASDEGHALELAYQCSAGWDDTLELETMAQRYVARRLT